MNIDQTDAAWEDDILIFILVDCVRKGLVRPCKMLNTFVIL